MDPRLVENMVTSGADGPKDKCCWYPFKQAHTRRRIHSDVYLNKNDPGDVQLYEGDDNIVASHRNLKGSELVLAGRQPYPNGLCTSTGTNPWHQPPSNTLILDQSVIYPDCTSKQFSCTSKQFFDDISAGNLWACDIEEEEKEREPPKLKSALKKTNRRLQHIPPPNPGLETSPIPKIEVVHEPRQQRRRSLGSTNSLVDDDAEKLQQIRHSFFGLSSGDVDPLASQYHRRECTLEEEKKEEDPSMSALHLLEMPELKDSAARPSTMSPPQQPIRRSRSFTFSRKSMTSAPRRNNDNMYHERNFPETRISVVPNVKPPHAASAEERPRISRSKSLSSKQNKKSGLVGGSRRVGEGSVRETRGRTIRTPAIEVQATRLQLDSVKDQFDDEDEAPPPEQSLLRNVRVIGGEPLSPCPDLEVVRQSSLVDNDSAFMDSVVSGGETPNSPIGGLLNSIISKASRSKASRRKASRSIATPGSKVSHHRRQHGRDEGTWEQNTRAAEKVPLSPLTESAGSCTKSASEDDCYGDDDESTSSTNSTFNPPREISRIKSDWTSTRESRGHSSKPVSEEDTKSKAKSEGELVRNVSNAYSYKKSMSEKVSRRLRSRDFRNRNHHSEMSPTETSPALTSKKARPFQRQPISSLTTTSAEIYSVAFRKPPVSPDGIRRDHISELTTETTKNKQRSRTNGSSVFGNLMKAMSRSEDDMVMEEDPISVSASPGLPAIGSNEWSKSELFASTHHTPRALGREKWSSPIQAAASPKSPERAVESPERAPKSPGTPKGSKLDFFAEDMKAFFEDFSTVGTSAFDDVEDSDDDDDEDSIFSDLRSADSSQLYASKGSIEASTVSPPISRATSEKGYISRQKILRKGSLFQKGEMLSDGSSAFEDEYDCMDNWLEYR